MEKVAGYKCSDSLRAEVSDLDFPSKQCRQSSEMTIRKERAAQLCDCMSWGTATPVAHLLQRVQVAPGITDKPWHAQGCPAAAMPCREWKHFATAAAAMLFSTGCHFPDQRADADSVGLRRLSNSCAHSTERKKW